MFRIKLQLLRLVTEAELTIPLTLKIKKGHWHYVLIENIDKAELDYSHSFEVAERDNEESTFELQLVSKTSEERGKLVGSAEVDVKEWPMQKVKGGRLKLSRLFGLDISIYSEYALLEGESSSMGRGEMKWVEQQQHLRSAKEQKTYLQSELQKLQQQIKDLTASNKRCEQKMQASLQTKLQKQNNHKMAKQDLSVQLKSLSSKLDAVNYSLTEMVNLLTGEGDVNTVTALNTILAGRSRSESSQRVSGNLSEVV